MHSNLQSNSQLQQKWTTRNHILYQTTWWVCIYHTLQTVSQSMHCHLMPIVYYITILTNSFYVTQCQFWWYTASDTRRGSITVYCTCVLDNGLTWLQSMLIRCCAEIYHEGFLINVYPVSPCSSQWNGFHNGSQVCSSQQFSSGVQMAGANTDRCKGFSPLWFGDSRRANGSPISCAWPVSSSGPAHGCEEYLC